MCADAGKSFPCRLAVGFELNAVVTEKLHGHIPFLARDTGITDGSFVRREDLAFETPSSDIIVVARRCVPRHFTPAQHVHGVGSLRKEAHERRLGFLLEGGDANGRGVEQSKQGRGPVAVGHRRAEMVEQRINVLVDPQRTHPSDPFFHRTGRRRVVDTARAHDHFGAPRRLAGQERQLAHTRLARGVGRIQREKKPDEHRDDRAAEECRDKHKDHTRGPFDCFEAQRGHSRSRARHSLGKVGSAETVKNQGEGDDEDGQKKDEERENRGRSLRRKDAVQSKVIATSHRYCAEGPLGDRSDDLGQLRVGRTRHKHYADCGSDRFPQQPEADNKRQTAPKGVFPTRSRRDQGQAHKAKIRLPPVRGRRPECPRRKPHCAAAL